MPDNVVIPAKAGTQTVDLNLDSRPRLREGRLCAGKTVLVPLPRIRGKTGV